MTWYALPFAATAGFAAWPLVEYAVHAWLSHRWSSRIAELHASHHIDPRRVFTPRVAWITGAAVVFGTLWLAIGPQLSAAATVGLLAGFHRYEHIHFCIHYRAPRSERQVRRHQHHLAHHSCNGRAYFGVSTRFWDRVFGTLPCTWRSDYAGSIPTRPAGKRI